MNSNDITIICGSQDYGNWNSLIVHIPKITANSLHPTKFSYYIPIMTYQDSVWLHYNNSLTREGVAVIIQPFGDGFAKKKTRTSFQWHHSEVILTYASSRWDIMGINGIYVYIYRYDIVIYIVIWYSYIYIVGMNENHFNVMGYDGRWNQQ